MKKVLLITLSAGLLALNSAVAQSAQETAKNVIQEEGRFFSIFETAGKLHYNGAWYENTYPTDYASLYAALEAGAPSPDPALIAATLDAIAKGGTSTQFLAWAFLDPSDFETFMADPRDIFKSLAEFSKVNNGIFLPEFFYMVPPGDNYYEKADLRGAYLGGSLELRNQNLAGKDLTGARVSAATLSKASNLTGVNLTGTGITRLALQTALITEGKSLDVLDTITY